jgi:hypothetical protein
MFKRLSVQLKLTFKILIKAYLSLKIWLATIIIAGATLFLILWINNLSLLFNTLTSPLSLSAKWDFLLTTPSFLTSSYEPYQAFILVLFSVLQGVNLALLIKLVRSRQYKSLVGATSKSGLALLATIIGVGCGACGSSLLAPLVASVGASSTLLLERLGFIILVFGIGLLLYSIVKLSMIIASAKYSN